MPTTFSALRATVWLKPYGKAAEKGGGARRPTLTDNADGLRCNGYGRDRTIYLRAKKAGCSPSGTLNAYLKGFFYYRVLNFEFAVIRFRFNLDPAIG